MGSTGRATGWTWRPSRQYKAYVQSQQQQQQQATQPPQPVNQNNPNVANQAPTPQNTPVGNGAGQAFASLDDKSMAAVINASKRATLPNQLADAHSFTQQVVFQAGINEKPMVLDKNAFNQFIKDNNLQNQVLSRSINSINYKNALGRNVKLATSDISDMLKYSRLNYIGGKHGGTAYGEGTYLAQTGKIGSNTGYGGTTLNAVLNPATARIISESQLYRDVNSWARSHPATAKALGSINSGNQSVYALAMGYNVVTSGSGYPTVHTTRSGDYIVVIDRKALVWLQ